MKDFKLALITGASTGLGKVLAEMLAARGIPLLLAARREDKLKEVARNLSVPTQVYAVDLNDAKERQPFLAWIREQNPDLVINNAGAGFYGPTLAQATEKQSAIVELNVQALLEITLESARALLKQKRAGTILNVSSAIAYFYYPSHCVYAATKTFVNHFSKTLDFELKSHGIRVLAACPGQIDTEFSFKAGGSVVHKKRDFLTLSPQKVAQEILKQISRGKPLEIIDWKYKLLVALSRLLPNAILMPFLNTTLRHRHHFTLEETL